MKNNLYKILRHKNYLLFMLISITIVAVTINPELLALKSTPIQSKRINMTQSNHQKKPTPSLSEAPTTQPKLVLAAATQVSQNPQSIITPTPTKIQPPTPNNALPINQPVQNTPTTGQPEQSVLHPTQNIESTTTSTPTPTQTIETVTLQIQLPSSSVTTTIHLKPNENVCDILQEAKDETKITSLTFDDSYMSMMHSRYVKEINGYQNNWTFTVNGTSPLGCSLSTPQPNDTIIWKFN